MLARSSLFLTAVVDGLSSLDGIWNCYQELQALDHERFQILQLLVWERIEKEKKGTSEIGTKLMEGHVYWFIPTVIDYLRRSLFIISDEC